MALDQRVFYIHPVKGKTAIKTIFFLNRPEMAALQVPEKGVE